MKTARFLCLVLVSLTLFSAAAEAQRNTRRTTRPRPTPTPRVSTIPPLEVRAARVKVSNQLANVNRFIDVLGPVAQNIETLDSEARTRKISQQSIESNDANKKKVVAAIRNLRTGLVALEAEFRSKAALKRYLTNIQGISELIGRSEDSAIAGRFVAAKDPLRDISVKLTATLTAIPDVEL